MSTLSDRMGRRRVASAPVHSAPADPAAPTAAHPGLSPDRGLSLAELAPGRAARVVGYDPAMDATVARRFFDLGIVPGTEVVTVRRAPLRDPVIYRVADYEIALRRTESRCIRVAPAASPSR